jgi:hypothetical protein
VKVRLASTGCGFSTNQMGAKRLRQKSRSINQRLVRCREFRIIG